jgi:hypothetical protein
MTTPTIAELDALVADVPPKTKIMPDGVRRWIPAAVPHGAGVEQVDAQFLADAALRLNTDTVSIPIDGGSFFSVAHETAPFDAIGWAHRAAVFEEKLYLEAEVLPMVNDAIEAGRVAFSSIDADFKTDESGAYVPGSALLVTHALTNTPRDRKQEPMQAIHAAHKGARVRFTTRARLAQENDMSKKSETKAEASAQAEETKTQAADAPAMTLEEAMAKIAELESKLAAMEATSAEMAAQLSATVEKSEAEQVKAQAERKESACVALVDEAIRCGQVAPASREKFLALARRDIETTRASIEQIPKRARPITTAAEASRSETSTKKASDWSESEQHLAASLRAGGLSEKSIEAAIARKRGER